MSPFLVGSPSPRPPGNIIFKWPLVLTNLNGPSFNVSQYAGSFLGNAHYEHYYYTEMRLWLFICCKTKLKKKLFFFRKYLCFLQYIHYLQKNVFIRKKSFILKELFLPKNVFTEKNIFENLKNIYLI